MYPLLANAEEIAHPYENSANSSTILNHTYNSMRLIEVVDEFTTISPILV